jgi:hypothetical protein
MLAAGLAVAIGAAGSRAQENAAPPLQMVARKPPEVRVGPYRILIDRITHNHTLTLNYQTGPAPPDEPLQNRRTVQLQLAVFAQDKAAQAGLTSLDIRTVTVEGERRTLELPHYGGMMENPNETAAVRAYLYIPSFPLRNREVRAVEGEIVSYDRSAPVELEIPIADQKPPVTVEKDGVRATLQELTVQGATVQIVLRLEGPENSVLAAAANDGTYGVSLYNTENRSAAPTGGTLTQPRGNQSEYRLGFQNLRGPVGKVKVRLLHRGGERRVYPFRIERIAIPVRPVTGAK